MEIEFFEDEAGEYIGSIYLDGEVINHLAKLAETEGYSTDEFIVQILKDKINDRDSSVDPLT